MKFIHLKRYFILLNITIFLFSTISLSRKKPRNNQHRLRLDEGSLVKNTGYDINMIEKNHKYKTRKTKKTNVTPVHKNGKIYKKIHI